MKAKLMIVASDKDYTKRLSEVLLKRHADVFEVAVYSSAEVARGALRQKRYDILLMDTEVARCISPAEAGVALVLWNESYLNDGIDGTLPRVKKYQRVSGIVGDVLEQFAKISGPADRDHRARITLIWSPAGGCGKTTVALAYAAKKAGEGRRATYLSFEPFCASNVYFPNAGTSISHVLGQLDGNVGMLLKSIEQVDTQSGISFFAQPENYEDMNILTEEDVSALIYGCAENSDELIVDTGSAYTMQLRQLMGLADKILVVYDGSDTCKSKLELFRTQNNVYGQFAEKMTIVANRGANYTAKPGEKALRLPSVEVKDTISTYKVLAGYFS